MVSESLYDGWVREGLVDEVVPDIAVLDSVVPPTRWARTTEEILADVRDVR